MLLPESLLTAIEELVTGVDRKKLQKSAEELSLRYRNPHSPTHQKHFIQTEEERLAYLCTRFPATFAANHYVLSELKARGFLEDIYSILDLGAGSGASLWAVREQFIKHLQRYTLVEQDAPLIDIGKRLLHSLEIPFQIMWMHQDYTKSLPEESYDLALLSYSLGEVPAHLWQEVLHQVMGLAQKFVVILEPGTPLGYKRILAMRDLFLKEGWSTLAPCPHNKPCPLMKEDWCHFSQRLPRTSLHKALKEGSLGFEDEKFSYIIMSKNFYTPEGRRILKPPLKRKGYIELEVCSTHQGILHQKISKKEKDFFKQAKKLSWGSFYSE